MRTLTLLSALCFCPIGFGQSTASLTGSVLDPSGAAIPGAKIVCRNLDTGQQTVASTSTSGLFNFPDLPVGSYEVTLSHEGFETTVRTGITLLTGQTVDLSSSLRIGQTGSVVEITGSIPLVQSTTSEVQMSVDSRQMADLPLNGRNAFDLAALAPGATTTDASTTPGQQDNQGLTVNGFGPTQNNWQLDGGTYNNLHFGSAPTLPNPDALQEFTIQTSSFSAESRGGGAVVKLTTRSGTNQIHGTLFEFFRNTSLDARNFFSVEPDPYKQNQYGGTVGGPIRKNKLFYFGSYQGTNKRGSPSPTLITVATPLQKAGDFTQSGKIVVDPLSGEPFPGNVIPANRIDPLSAKLLKYYPNPTYGATQFLENPPAGRDDYQWMVKADYYLGTRDVISGRFFHDNDTFDRDEGTVPGFLAHNTFNNRTVLVSDTHTFSPGWILHAAFNYLQTYRHELPVSPITLQELGSQVKPAADHIPNKVNVGITGYTKFFTGRGIDFLPQVKEFKAEVSHSAGRHFLRFGSGLRWDSEYALNLSDELGNFTFTAARTTSATVKGSGDAFASFLLGAPATFVQATSAPENFVLRTFDPWIQDDWRISRRFTLNLGLRWEPWLPPSDTLGPLTGFIPGVQSTVAPKIPKGLLYSGDPGLPASILSPHWATFSPRAGFAWDIAGNSKTVVRGGYGFFRAGTEFFGMQRTFASSIPGRVASLSLTNPPSFSNPYANYPGPIPFPTPPYSSSTLANLVLPASSAVTAFDPAAKPQYAESWNFTIERQLMKDSSLSVSYVGNHFLHGMMTYEENPAILAPGATVSNEPSRVRYPGFASVAYGTSANHGFYHALQVQYTKRAGRGLTMLANYTWAKAIDITSSGLQGIGQTNVGPRDPLHLNIDKGPADYDLTHQFKLAAVYDVPKLHDGPSLARAVANGWQLNAIAVLRTGLPFTCRSGVDNALTGVSIDHCDQVSQSTGTPAGVDRIAQWFNPAAFTANAIGTFGNTGRNALRRPSAANVNASLFRIFPLTERARLEFRAEAFNVMNHANLDLFTTIGGYRNYVIANSPTAFAITSAADPRLFQFALKLRFSEWSAGHSGWALNSGAHHATAAARCPGFDFTACREPREDGHDESGGNYRRTPWKSILRITAKGKIMG